jgi:hypothetical protein
MVTTLAACGGGDDRGGSNSETPVASGPAALSWTSDVKGAPFRVLAEEGAVVVGSEGPPHTVTALDPSDGTVKWQRQFTDAVEANWFGLEPSGQGPLFSYSTQNAGVLRMLDPGTGKDIWKVDLDSAVYDMSAGKDFVWTNFSETDGAWLNLHTGERTAEGDVGEDARAGLALGDDLLIAPEGTEIVGLIEGKERWRLDPGVGEILAFTAHDGSDLIAVGQACDNPDPQAPQVCSNEYATVHFDQNAATVLDGTPAGFVPLNVDKVADDRSVVIAVHYDRAKVVVLAVGDKLEQVGMFDYPGGEVPAIIGSRVAFLPQQGGPVTVYRLPDGSKLNEIAVDPDATAVAFEGPRGYVVTQDGNTVSLHR